MELTLEFVKGQESIYNHLLKTRKESMVEIGAILNDDAEVDDITCIQKIMNFLENNGIKHYMYVPSRKRDVTYHDDFRNKCFSAYFNTLG